MTETEKQLLALLAEQEAQQPTYANPLNDDDWDGNDDQIDALKHACRTYGTLHDLISGIVEDPDICHHGTAAVTLTISHEHYKALVQQLLDCVALNVNDD